MQSFVYILTNKSHTTLYIGITNNLIRRVYEHKQKVQEGFSKKYKVDKLVYYEQFTDIAYAIEREKQLKRWNRSWKEHLIKQLNPHWKDLYNEIYP